MLVIKQSVCYVALVFFLGLRYTNIQLIFAKGNRNNHNDIVGVPYILYSGSTSCSPHDEHLSSSPRPVKLCSDLLLFSFSLQSRSTLFIHHQFYYEYKFPPPIYMNRVYVHRIYLQSYLRNPLGQT